MSARQYPAASLIGIQGTRSRPECLLHVPRRNVGNEGMEKAPPPHLLPVMFSELKIDCVLPLFLIPSSSVSTPSIPL